MCVTWVMSTGGIVGRGKKLCIGRAVPTVTAECGAVAVEVMVADLRQVCVGAITNQAHPNGCRDVDLFGLAALGALAIPVI